MADTINGGYIMVARKIQNSDIFHKPPLYLKVWLYLLCRASHTDYKGLGRGQLWTSIPEIREACRYYIGYRKKTPTAKEIRSVLDYLRNPHEEAHEGAAKGAMIVTAKGTRGMLVTICNYSVYQVSENYEGRDEGHDERPANGSRRELQGRRINKNSTRINKKECVMRFAPPSLDDVQRYCHERGNSIDSQTFIDFYDARGWKLSSGIPMKNWKAAVRTWEHREQNGESQEVDRFENVS